MTAASSEPAGPVDEPVTVPDTPAEAEWPPREWREGSRGMGAKTMYQVVGAIAAIMVVLVIVAFWGMGNG
jgi:hypothetical protein